MAKPTRQEIRDAEAYKKKLNDQIGFYKEICVLNGPLNGYCSGKIDVFGPNGHGLCQRHQEIVREQHKKDRGVRWSGSSTFTITGGDITLDGYFATLKGSP